MTVHYKTEAGRFSVAGDYAVVTVPFSVLRTIEMLTPLSPGKQRAIRQLNYHASTKILFQVRERIWETRGRDLRRRHGHGAAGPAHELPDARSRRRARGVLLASYTWGQDALQWGAMDEETRLEEALDDVARIHPRIREVYEVGASHAWYSDRWARGAFAMFAPEQQTELQADIVAPEGRIHFAGEHCSLYHAWIQGALESGIRAAQAIHEAPAPMTERRRPAVLIDCDPGHDDALAILLAARHLDVRAITAVHGNAPLARTHVNARKVLELGGLSDIPVAAGCDRPLVREAHFAPDVHGESGLDGPDLPEPTMALVDAHATDVIIELSRSVPGPPRDRGGAADQRRDGAPARPDARLAGRAVQHHGRVADVGKRDPGRRVQHLVRPGGGAHRVRERRADHDGRAERDDAVDRDPERRAQLRATGRRAATAAADMLDHYAIGEGQYSGLPGGALHDPMAVATLIDPSIVTTVPMHVAVETRAPSPMA